MVAKYDVTQEPTTVFGLKYKPSIAPKYSNEHDWVDEIWNHPRPFLHMTELDLNAVREGFGLVRDHAKLILEIGVDRPSVHGEPSSTNILLSSKLPETIYVGVDLEPKHFDGPNVHTLQCNSLEKDKVYAFLDQVAPNTLIDFLFIDGHHSVDVATNDWSYTDRLVPGGVVGMHDTNYHPGPTTLFDAIDETKFNKHRFGMDCIDWGLSYFQRIA